MKYLFRIGGLFACFALVGCGPKEVPRAPVTGKVTLAGKSPLPGGAIRFQLASDPAFNAGGSIQSDGTYEVLNAPVGECKVIVDNHHLQPGGVVKMPTINKPPAEKMANGPPKGADLAPEMATGAKGPVKYTKIDPSFASAESTSLKATVQKGSNSFDFDVK